MNNYHFSLRILLSLTRAKAVVFFLPIDHYQVSFGPFLFNFRVFAVMCNPSPCRSLQWMRRHSHMPRRPLPSFLHDVDGVSDWEIESRSSFLMVLDFFVSRSVAIRWTGRTLTRTNSWSCFPPSPATPWPSTRATGTWGSSMNGRTRRVTMPAVTRPHRPPCASASTCWDPSDSVGQTSPSDSVSRVSWIPLLASSLHDLWLRGRLLLNVFCVTLSCLIHFLLGEVTCGVRVVVAFSSLARILGECSTFIPACAFFLLSSSFFFFFEVEISLKTLIPLFMPGSVHSGSANVPW